MLAKLIKLSSPYITPLNVDGMSGRKMVHPTRSQKHTRQILFVYGIHGNMERFYGIVHFLARYGTVTMPDLPGFGGMETFYKIGKKPNFDAYADYLADFVTKNYKDTKITIAGLSYGFVVATRMLQRHPELCDQVELIVSVMGLADSNNLSISTPRRWFFRFLLMLCRHQPFIWFFNRVLFSERWLSRTYRPDHPKMLELSKEERPEFIAFETYLWRINDLRTYGTAMKELFSFHHDPAKVDLPLHHIGTEHDHWLNDADVRRDLANIYTDVTYHQSSITNHGGTAYDSEDEARELVPDSVIKLLEQKS